MQPASLELAFNHFEHPASSFFIVNVQDNPPNSSKKWCQLLIRLSFLPPELSQERVHVDIGFDPEIDFNSFSDQGLALDRGQDDHFLKLVFFNNDNFSFLCHVPDAFKGTSSKDEALA